MRRLLAQIFKFLMREEKIDAGSGGDEIILIDRLKAFVLIFLLLFCTAQEIC